MAFGNGDSGASSLHPLYLGWATAFWVTPMMTLGHLLFAAALTTYMALAVRFEERDLVEHFGHQYEDYQRRVPMILPRLMRDASAADALHGAIATTHPHDVAAPPSPEDDGDPRTLGPRLVASGDHGFAPLL